MAGNTISPPVDTIEEAGFRNSIGTDGTALFISLAWAA
jgi:hypothetical protein